ncbi:MAG: hypothetical protein KH353_05440 [Clostridium sp.]|jgi:hypothetical protein|nr:hypothetical protein [Clostridium sp.]
MTGEELKKRGFLYFDGIREGLEALEHEIITMNREQAFCRFSELKKEYGSDNSFLDFYLFSLKEEERKKAESVLTESEIEALKAWEKEAGFLKGDQLIFPLDETLLRTAVILNETGMLFSTMYFAKLDRTQEKAETWWGNFNGEYIRFYK